MRITILCAALLAGCTSAPLVESAGAIACVRVDALTTQTTTVYIASGLAGTIVVRPDCTIAAELHPNGTSL